MTAPSTPDAPMPAIPSQPQHDGDDFTPIHEVAGPNSSTSIFELADRLLDWKAHKDALAAATKDANEIIGKLEGALVERMVDEENSKFTRAGKTFYLTDGRVFASPKAGQKEALIEWLSKNGHEGLVGQSISAGSLGTFCKELMDASETGELPEPLAELVNAHRPMSIGIRKA